jgi:hypothetical protein
MLERKVDMRVEAATLAAEVRQLKIEERRALGTARRILFLKTDEQTDNRGRKYTKRVRTQDPERVAKSRLAYHKHRNIYLERMACRREARLHHLARMLLKGVDYHRVEAVTYEKVDAEELYERVWQWDPSITEDYVVEWLNYDTKGY